MVCGLDRGHGLDNLGKEQAQTAADATLCLKNQPPAGLSRQLLGQATGTPSSKGAPMDETVKAHLDSRIDVMTPYLQTASDQALVQRAQEVLDGITQLAQESPDANSFEQALAASPLNGEYGMVYSQLMTAGNATPSLGQAFGAMAKGVAQHKETFAQITAESVASDAALNARLALEDAVLEANHDDYMAAKQAMRDDPVAGTLETAGNLLGGLKGLFGRKK